MSIDTPCIGICSTVYGDAICRGCKRHFHEVIAWNAYPEAEKKLIYQRLATQIAEVVFNYLEVIDAALLGTKIRDLNITLHPHVSVAEQAFHLLRLGADKIKRLDRYGLQVKSHYAQQPLSALFNEMDTKVYARASKSTQFK